MQKGHVGLVNNNEIYNETTWNTPTLGMLQKNKKGVRAFFQDYPRQGEGGPWCTEAAAKNGQLFAICWQESFRQWEWCMVGSKLTQSG